MISNKVTNFYLLDDVDETPQVDNNGGGEVPTPVSPNQGYFN